MAKTVKDTAASIEADYTKAIKVSYAPGIRDVYTPTDLKGCLDPYELHRS